jgi:transcriptional regulator with XRE-family HTH domain
LRQDESDGEGVAMAIGERIREVRKERGWSQADLGKKIGTDSQYVSRYETGRITPSVDALVRLADVLEVSTDYLVRDGAPRKVLEGHNLGKLGDRLAELAELSDADQEVASQVIDALIAKSRLKILAGGIA